MCLVAGCSLATDVADGHFPEPEPEPVPDEEEEECHDNNSASIVATGYDCASVVRRQECLLVYQFCRCSCGAAQSQAAAPPLQNDCAVVPGFLPPIIGALAGRGGNLGRGVRLHLRPDGRLPRLRRLASLVLLVRLVGERAALPARQRRGQPA